MKIMLHKLAKRKFFLTGFFVLLFIFSWVFSSAPRFLSGSSTAWAAPIDTSNLSISSLIDAWRAYVSNPITVTQNAPPPTSVESGQALPRSTSGSTTPLLTSLRTLLQRPDIRAQLQGAQGVQGIQGVAGPAGPQGLQGASGGGGTYFAPLASPSGIPINYNSGQIVGNSGGYASLGVQDLLADKLSVSGNSTLTGSLTVSGGISGTLSGSINPSFTLGSVAFQGASGLSQDNANFFWDDTNNRLGLGTDTTFGTLDLRQSANGTTLFYARRITDTAPTGDFILYRNAADDTDLFRVDNSGNVTSTGSITGGAQTITSTSIPQLTIQYDASNQWSSGTSSVGVTTFTFTGTAPQGLFLPGANSTTAFQFQNAAATPILNIDTTNVRVGIGTAAPLGTFHAVRDAVSDLHTSLAAHDDFLFESSGDGVIQLASSNVGAVGTGIILTNQAGASDGRHWVVEHTGVNESNDFAIGYYASTADGENIIGSVVPDFKITTVGNVEIAGGGTEALPVLTLANDPDTGLWQAAANGLSISTNAKERMRITQGGGIGDGLQWAFMDFDDWSTANSNSSITSVNTFHVFSNGEVRAEFESGDDQMALYIEAGTGFDSFYGLQEGATNHWSLGQDSSAGGDFFLSTGFGNVAPKLVVTKADSYFGFGTTAPRGRMHVRASTGTPNLHSPAAGSRDFIFESPGDGVLQIAGIAGGTVGTAIVLTNQQDATDGRHWVIEHAGSTENDNFGIGYYPTTADAQNMVGLVTQDLTITTAGLVGIGTTAPQSLLDVQGAAGAAGILTLATKELTVDDGDILGRIDFNAPLESDASDSILVGASIWAEADAEFTTTVNSTELVFATGTSEAATEKMRLTSDGKLGIGDSTPSFSLDITGSQAIRGASSQFRIKETDAADPEDGWHFSVNNGVMLFLHEDNDAGPAYTNALTLSVAGRVGILDTNPDAQLDILGTGTDKMLILTNTNGTDTDVSIGLALAEGTNTFTMGIDDDDSDAFVLGTTALGTGNIMRALGNSIQFRTETDSTTGFQVLDTNGGTPILNIDTTNERVGIGNGAPVEKLSITDGNLGFFDLAVQGTTILGARQAALYDGTSSNSTFIYSTKVISGTTFPFDTYGALVFHGRSNTTNTMGGFAFVPNNTTDVSMVINNTGQVGINTTAPQSLLDVQGAAGAAGILTLATKELTVDDGDILGRIDFNSPLESDASDSILVGASIWAEADAEFTTTVNDTDLVFATGLSEVATEKMRLDSSGNLTVNTLGTGADYYVCASAAGLLSESAGACAGSSLEYKQNIENLYLGGLETINQLRPVTFDWKPEYRPGEPRQLGFIAQEVEAIDPILATYRGDTLHGVKYAEMSALLVKAIQELDLKLESTTLSIPEPDSFGDRFFTNLFTRLRTWLADAGNGVEKLFARIIRSDTVYTKTICVGEPGSETCITQAELNALLNNANNSNSGGSNENPPPPPPADEEEPSVEEENTEPPVENGEEPPVEEEENAEPPTEEGEPSAPTSTESGQAEPEPEPTAPDDAVGTPTSTSVGADEELVPEV